MCAVYWFFGGWTTVFSHPEALFLLSSWKDAELILWEQAVRSQEGPTGCYSEFARGTHHLWFVETQREWRTGGSRSAVIGGCWLDAC